jgi:hypothetical protein
MWSAGEPAFLSRLPSDIIPPKASAAVQKSASLLPRVRHADFLQGGGVDARRWRIGNRGVM